MQKLSISFRTLLLFCLALLSSNIHAQTPGCAANLDFETGAIAPWECFIGMCCPISATTPTAPVPGRHTITSGIGTDYYGGFPVVAPGGSYSLCLGNSSVGSQAEKVRYYIHPGTLSNSVLVYRFAVVLEDPMHTPAQQPRFEVNLYDSATGTALPCGYLSYVSSSSLPGFKLSSHIGTGGGNVYYHAWDSGSVNLSAYHGSTVIVDFSTGDCALGGHFGYAYLDVSCGHQIALATACDTVNPFSLTGPPGYASYKWYDSSNFAISYGTGSPITLPNPHTAKTYAVIVTPFTGLGCIDTLYVRVVPTALTLNPTPTSYICSSGSVVITAGATDIVAPLTYVWSPSTGLSCTTCASPTATPTSGTTYSVTVTNPYGCSKDTTITVNVGSPVLPIIGPGSLCAGTTIALSSSTTGGAWSTAATVATVGSTGIVTGISGGTALISYTVVSSCGSTSVTKTVTVNPIPSPGTISGTGTVCTSSTITLSSTTPGGVWSVSNTNISISGTGVVTGLVTGSATVSYTVSNSCGTRTGTVPITIITLPVSSLSGPTNVCIGKTVSLTGLPTGGTWSSSGIGATVSSLGVVTGVAAGISVITYTVTNLCGAALSMDTVTAIAPLVAGISTASVVCVGSTVTLSGIPAGGTWSIIGSTASVSPTGVVSGILPGIATIYYSVSNICGTATASTTIAIAPLPVAGTITGAPRVCATDSMLISATAPGGTWSCSPNATISPTGWLSGVSPGTATITYSVSNYCGTVTTTLTVTVDTMPSPGVISGLSSICVGHSITISTSSSGGTWTTSNPAIVVITSSGVATGIVQGTAYITYAMSTAHCSSLTTETITVDPLPSPVTISGTTHICASDSITLTTSQPGGIWNSSNSLITVSSSGVVKGLLGGTALISYTIVNACGNRIATKTITIDPSPDPGNITGPGHMCAGNTITLTNATSSGTSSWNSSNNTVASIDSKGIVSGRAPGTCTITFTATGIVSGCQSQASYTITVSPTPPNGTISGPAQTCGSINTQLTETISGGTWGTTVPGVASIDITGLLHPRTSGPVLVTYTIPPNSDGCGNVDTFLFTILSAANFTIHEVLTNITCKGKTDGSISVATTGGNGPWTYAWSTGSSSSSLQGLTAGHYDIKVYDANTGCDAAKGYTITEPDDITADVNITNEVCNQANGAVILIVRGGTPPYSYHWSDNSINDRIVDLLAGNYTVAVADLNGCAGKFVADVATGDCPDFEVHNGISPNGDGINDYWQIDGIAIYKHNLVQLFDKWGDKVFEQHSYDNKWDGRGKNGNLLPDGTYFYVIKLDANKDNDAKNVLTGSMLIKR